MSGLAAKLEDSMNSNMPFHTSLRHPLSGEPLQAVWRGTNGVLRWPIIGAAEGDGIEGGAGTGQSAGTGAAGEGTQSGAATGTEGSTGTAGETGQSAGQSTSDETVARAEFDRLKNQLSAADRKREEAERRLQEIDNANKTELQKATERAEAAEKRIAELTAQNQTLLLEKLTLSDSEFGADKWQDPEDILEKLGRAVASEAIGIQDGRPDAKQVKTFLKDLAKQKPYLLKATANGAPQGASGASVGSGDGRGASTKEQDAELRKKYRIR